MNVWVYGVIHENLCRNIQDKELRVFWEKIKYLRPSNVAATQLPYKFGY